MKLIIITTELVLSASKRKYLLSSVKPTARGSQRKERSHSSLNKVKVQPKISTQTSHTIIWVTWVKWVELLSCFRYIKVFVPWGMTRVTDVETDQGPRRRGYPPSLPSCGPEWCTDSLQTPQLLGLHPLLLGSPFIKFTLMEKLCVWFGAEEL